MDRKSKLLTLIYQQDHKIDIAYEDENYERAWNLEQHKEELEKEYQQLILEEHEQDIIRP